MAKKNGSINTWRSMVSFGKWRPHGKEMGKIIGHKREHVFKDALEGMVAKRWLVEYVPTRRWSALDREGRDGAAVAVVMNQKQQWDFLNFSFSVVGPGGVEDHERRHNVPNIIVDLEMGEKDLQVSLEIQTIATLALDILKRVGDISWFAVHCVFGGSAGVSYVVGVSLSVMRHVTFSDGVWVKHMFGNCPPEEIIPVSRDSQNPIALLTETLRERALAAQ